MARETREHVSGVPGLTCRPERSSVSTGERDEKRRRRMVDIALREIYNNGTMELSVRDLAGLLLESPIGPTVWPFAKSIPGAERSRPIFPLLLSLSPFITSLLETRAFSRKPPPPFLLFSRCVRDVARIGRRYNPITACEIRDPWEDQVGRLRFIDSLTE